MYETPLTGLILTGGGARAAYQVGVLRALARLRRDSGADRARNPFGVIVGTSAGAVNAAALACGARAISRPRSSASARSGMTSTPTRCTAPTRWA